MNTDEETGKLEVTDVTENEDGSANYEFSVDEGMAIMLKEVGLEITLYCAAYGVSLQEVRDWISSHEPAISPMTDEERQRAKEKEEANKNAD